jgi:hypothetical protein
MSEDTNIYEVEARSSNEILGIIRWSTEKREYVFIPEIGISLTEELMDDARRYIQTLSDDKVVREFWWLPRPSKSKYKGSFPLAFETKLYRLLGIDPLSHKILHPFGGVPEHGDTVELPSQKEWWDGLGISPTYWGDAHDLDFIEDGAYDLVLCDPPYSDTEAEEIYGVTRKLDYGKWVAEAARVTAKRGHLALYHTKLLPRPKGWRRIYLIAIATRTHHTARLCGVFRRMTAEEMDEYLAAGGVRDDTKVAEYLQHRGSALDG